MANKKHICATDGMTSDERGVWPKFIKSVCGAPVQIVRGKAVGAYDYFFWLSDDPIPYMRTGRYLFSLANGRHYNATELDLRRVCPDCLKHFDPDIFYDDSEDDDLVRYDALLSHWA